MMIPVIETFTEKKFIGKRMNMSLSENRTGELWKNFMQKRKEIKNSIGSNCYSINVYGNLYFANFNPDTVFEKWAAIEVNSFDLAPDEMEPFALTGGLYAVFLYKGHANKAAAMFQYIFETWLPGSDYVVDNRSHFEILGERYKKDDPASEEEIWIPIRPKN